MKKILLTAFDPFGGDAFNAAQYAVENCKSPEGVELHKMIVPTVFGLAAEKVCQEIEILHPDAVICVGEGASRGVVTPERIGINVMDARIPDNAGYQPVDEKIAEYGPDAYFTLLPIKRMVELIREAGVSAEVSNSAGTFVCNSLMYGVLHHVMTCYSAENRPAAGFIHVPAERPVTNADGTVTPVSLNSSIALSQALKALL